EQLGYGAENGTWRNFYLSGTTELREGRFGTPTVTASADIIANLSPRLLFDALAVQINGPEAWDLKITIDIVLTDTAETYRLGLTNGVLTHTAAQQQDSADLTLTTTARRLPALALGDLTPDAL
ncbi:MBL fold metallo-hydrolase, partial [Streptomyces sp. SID7499]|nr:MBL fold metallo-hydrolase [Streptomyces sp. SID7499]